VSVESVGKQLRGWDAATFRTASGDASMRSTVVAMAILESAPDWQRLRARIERLTLFVPELRMRPLHSLVGFASPRLSIDPDFDLDFHVRRYRLPEGGGWKDLLADARRLSLGDFDYSRPLWEASLVEGLPDGHSAFLLKLHHSIADGAATVMIALTLFELASETNLEEPVPPSAPVGADVSWQELLVANSKTTWLEQRGRKRTAGNRPAFSENIAHRPCACTRKNSGNNRLDHPGDNGIRRTTVTFIDRARHHVHLRNLGISV